ncbi:hypothetical protein RHGRI_036465 [Rhododendron griersonianum]|uniref:CCR4-NOT transcription complex subunit 4 n=1 Tax=Rhododendron griersonianum TaxID=479676 RepID=A0AAV6HTQ2_9ERIC|nr:hypothetical protein RHGRI_036465 [Rhododendron griersonianum]
MVEINARGMSFVLSYHLLVVLFLKAIMSDQGEKTCPLCAEEMDLTDQQLKPCKCGYEICIWCWHQIMDMAEKNETEGRCPACRAPYNKEKIVGTAAKCERLVAEMNMDRKTKLQKPRSKTSDGRKQLSNVRVIRRNLAYIVGLPLNLADEDLLQRREYFSQYGKVLKVSISRTAAGTIQQFANNTCSVYITYSKEEEAVRCIQSVHGFVLDGRSLRACFGTTKYCHAWLRNLPCSNPDCLYLHEIGSQEDSFTKDEIVSEYTRGRVQQITGATNNMQRRSGDVLPPPAEEYHINSSATSGKSLSKSASNNPASSISDSPPNSSSGRSVALPGATFWGMRASTNQPPSGTLPCSNGPSYQKHETSNGSIAFSTAAGGTIQVPPSNVDVGKKHIPKEECRTAASEAPATPGIPATTTVDVQLQSPQLLEDKDRCISAASNNTNSFDLSGQSFGFGADKDLNISSNGNIQSACSDMVSLRIGRRLGDEHSADTTPNSSLSETTLINSPQKNQILRQNLHLRGPSTSIALGKALFSTDDIFVTREQSDFKLDSLTREHSDWSSDSQTQVGKRDSQVASPEVKEDFRSFEDQGCKDSEIVTSTSYLPNLSNSFHVSRQSSLYSSQQNEPYGSVMFNKDPQIVDNRVDKGLLLRSSDVPKVPNGYSEDMISKYIGSDTTVGHSFSLPSEVKKKVVGRFGSEASDADHNVAADMGESSIISNMLSMDFDAWDESLTSPQNLVKLLGDNNRREASIKLSSSWKVQNSSQSRFSFARQEESKNGVSDIGPSLNNNGRVPKDRVLGLELPEKSKFNTDKLGDFNGFSTFNNEEPDKFAGSYSYFSSNKLSGELSLPSVDISVIFGFLSRCGLDNCHQLMICSGSIVVSRGPVSAPPGFTGPNRAPPPGFSSPQRTEPTFDAMSWNTFVDASSLRNQYEAPPTGNSGSGGDIEFMDPAILAVGKGRLPSGLNNAATSDMRSNYSSQLSSAFENGARLQVLMQRSISPIQNQRFTNFEDGFAPHSDAYRIPSRIMEQPQASSPSPLSHLNLQQSSGAIMSNGQWDGWNEVHSGNAMGMAELLRNERLGFNTYTSYEDSKFRMPNSGDIYNRTYGL